MRSAEGHQCFADWQFQKDCRTELAAVAAAGIDLEM